MVNNNIEGNNDDDNNNANANNQQSPSEVSKLQEESEQKMKFNKEFIGNYLNIKYKT